MTFGQVAVGFLAGLCTGAAQLYLAARLVHILRKSAWLIVLKMLIYAGVLTGMVFLSVGHLVGCMIGILMVLFTGALHIYRHTK